MFIKNHIDFFKERDIIYTYNKQDTHNILLVQGTILQGNLSLFLKNIFYKHEVDSSHNDLYKHCAPWFNLIYNSPRIDSEGNPFCQYQMGMGNHLVLVILMLSKKMF